MNEIRRSVEAAPVVPIDDYHYLVHPLTDGIPLVEPDLLESVVEEIRAVADLESADKIVAPEAMGIHIATALSLATRVPFVVVRKRSYGLPGEVAIAQTTAYGSSDLYLNGIEAGDRVVVVDDMYSSGGTVEAVVSAHQEVGAAIHDVVVVFRRGEVDPDLPIEVTSLYRVSVEDGKGTVDR